MTRTGLLYDPVFLQHDPGAYHPERPERLTAILRRLEQSGLLANLVRVAPRPVELSWLETVHTQPYPELVRTTCEAGLPVLPTGDTNVCRASYNVARVAAGGALAACDAVMQGQVRNAFCAVRPPGHHAGISGGMGFCVFNNVAVAARYLQRQHGLQRIAILDWDVHHGNGTQEIFYEDPTVLFQSTHLWPFYPGTGLAGDTGAGEGEGFTINIPLDFDDGDSAIVQAFDEVFRPATVAFKPEFVLVSAGYDAHRDDSLGQMAVTDQGFKRLTEIVKELADQCCDGRLLLVLEGGYTHETLARNVCDSLVVMAG